MKEAVLGRPHDSLKFVVEVKGIEPLAPCMQSRCSPAELHPHGVAVGEGRRRGRLGWLTFPLEL